MGQGTYNSLGEMLCCSQGGIITFFKVYFIGARGYLIEPDSWGLYLEEPIRDGRASYYERYPWQVIMMHPGIIRDVSWAILEDGISLDAGACAVCCYEDGTAGCWYVQMPTSGLTEQQEQAIESIAEDFGLDTPYWPRLNRAGSWGSNRGD